VNRENREENDQYTMVKSLRVQNFRCFKDVSAGDLGRINVVVGRNATGKTALLESLFLAGGGSPAVVLTLRRMRGMGGQAKVDPTSLDRLWEDLFNSFVTTTPLDISLVDSVSGERALTICREGYESHTLPLEGQQSSPFSDAPVKFVWKRHGHEDIAVKPRVTPQGLTFENAPSPISAVMFPANFSLDPEETSKRLSDLRRTNKMPLLLKTIQSVFPDVRDISPEHNSGVWMVYVSVESVASQMIPAALHSAGMNRFVAILLGIASVPGGVVMVDEIENGIYYKALTDVWRAVYAFATEFSTQVFATTHSMECLKAAHVVIHESRHDFALIRANLEHGDRWLDTFTGDKLDGALEHGFELR
jgi:hypothetical protein